MFELADSGSSGGVSPSVYLSISLSLTLFLFRPPPVLSSRCVSLSSVTFPPVMRRRAMLRWHRCARPRSQRQGPVRSPRSPRSLVSPTSPTFLFHLSVSRVSFLSFRLSPFLSLYSTHYRLNSCLSRRTSRPIARGRRGSRSPLPRGAFMILPIRSAAPAAGIHCHAQ